MENRHASFCLNSPFHVCGDDDDISRLNRPGVRSTRYLPFTLEDEKDEVHRRRMEGDELSFLEKREENLPVWSLMDNLWSEPFLSVLTKGIEGSENGTSLKQKLILL